LIKVYDYLNINIWPADIAGIEGLLFDKSRQAGELAQGPTKPLLPDDVEDFWKNSHRSTTKKVLDSFLANCSATLCHHALSWELGSSRLHLAQVIAALKKAPIEWKCRLIDHRIETDKQIPQVDELFKKMNSYLVVQK